MDMSNAGRILGLMALLVAGDAAWAVPSVDFTRTDHTITNSLCDPYSTNSLVQHCLPAAYTKYKAACAESNPYCMNRWVIIKVWHDNDPSLRLYTKVAFYRVEDTLLAFYEAQGFWEVPSTLDPKKYITFETVHVQGDIVLGAIFAAPRPTTRCQWGCTCSIDTCRGEQNCMPQVDTGVDL